MTSKPDAGTLDAMVQGLDEPHEDNAAWSWLVSYEDGPEEWDRAARRRVELDRLSEFVLDRPLVAEALARARRMSAMIGRLAILLRDPSLTAQPQPAMLGPMPTDATPLSVEWGRVVVVHAAVKQVVRLDTSDVVWGIPSNQKPVRVPADHGWELLDQEAPVMLLALRDAREDLPFEQAVGAATAIASVLVVETAPEDRGET